MAYTARRYFKTLSKASNHVRYIAFRDRYQEHEKKGLFNDKADHISAIEFAKGLDTKLTSHPSVAVAHTLLFSMSGDEFERSGFEYGDYKSIIRTVISEYEAKQGIKLEWAAAEHFKPNNPHCHVVIKSTFKDRDGVEHRLKLTKEDVLWFKETFENEIDHKRGFDKEQLLKMRGIDRDLKNRSRSPEIKGTDLLNSLIYQIKRKAQEKEHDYERGM